jgi:hypothetical protein
MFDFGSLFTNGGYLMALATWTIDSGSGLDDMFVAISSRGEVVIYEGTDPAAAETWAMKGVFRTGNLLGQRAVVKVEGDLVLMTHFGLLSLSKAIAMGNTSEGQSDAYLSRKIQYLATQLAADLPTTFGWEAFHASSGNLILVNVPLLTGSGQMVLSTITKGWSQFDNWDALCWTRFGNSSVYGDRDGNVWRAWEGYTDGSIQSDAVTITQGNPVEAEVQTSFNFFQSLSVVKHAKMVRPTFVGGQEIPYAIMVNPDFDYDAAVLPGATDLASGAIWGAGIWGTDEWVGSSMSGTQHVWSGVAAIGSAFALRLAFYANRPVLWASFDMMYEEGFGI